MKERIVCYECKGVVCKLCNGKGTMSESSHSEPWDRGDGVMYGSSSWTLKRCPHGCPSTMRVIL